MAERLVGIKTDGDRAYQLPVEVEATLPSVASVTAAQATADSAASAAATAQAASFACGATAARLASGEAVTVAWIGDSGLAGASATAGLDVASVVKTELDALFSVTTTKTNRALSGSTLLGALSPGWASPTQLDAVIAAAPALVVIAFGHNDIRSVVSSTYTPGTGYPSVAGQAALEHIIRRLRIEVPGVDIVVSSSWPYTGTSAGSNAFLEDFHASYRRVAESYGCPWVDYYAALVALGVGSGADDTYVHPTGHPFAQHPTDAGYAVWADLVMALVPDGPALSSPSWVPPRPQFGAERYTAPAWSAFSGGARSTGSDGSRFIGAGWSNGQNFPNTSSTATNSIEFQWIGHEALVRLDTGVGHGVVNIVIDGLTLNASLDLSALGAGQSRLPLPVYGPGVHRATVTVVSGSVTCRGIEVQSIVGQHIPYNSGLVTVSGTWTNPGSDATRYDGNAHQTTTQNDTITVEWVGTDLAAQLFLYTSALLVDITTDGVTRAGLTVTPAVANQMGNYAVESNLSYGKHSTTITLKSGTGSRALVVTAFFAFDRRRCERPNTLDGVAVTGDAVDFAGSLLAKPTVALTADDATSTTPPYPSSLTAAGFTVEGTASAAHSWRASTQRHAW